MGNYSRVSKRFFSVFAAFISTFAISGSMYASPDLTPSIIDDPRAIVAETPTVNLFNDLNAYDRFIFSSGEVSIQGTSEPSSKWDWSDGTYNISGSSNSSTLYTNYYFTNVTGKTFNLTAGSSNRITVDLVHKGFLIQSVVSTWTIDAGSSKTVKISASDLNGKKDSDNYYFRFNSNPIGKSYSVSGTFK